MVRAASILEAMTRYISESQNCSHKSVFLSALCHADVASPQYHVRSGDAGIVLPALCSVGPAHKRGYPFILLTVLEFEPTALHMLSKQGAT